ncbi:MAG: hypothetical protein GXN99_03010 [Candidatus Nanohaloarchaeota archaeon]|nr:hypothetical protein [Candidatus Nanohaloarchaeota archaeon]
MLCLIIFYGLRQEEVSHTLGYSKEKALNLKGVWYGVYEINNKKGCVVINITTQQNDTFYGMFSSTDPILVKETKVKILTSYIDLNYGMLKIINDDEDLYLAGKVRDSKIAKIKGMLKGVKLNEFKIVKNKDICEELKSNLSVPPLRINDTNPSYALQDILPPDCYEKIKSYKDAFNAEDIRPLRYPRCSFVAYSIDFNKINEKPIYENESYIEYANISVYVLSQLEGYVVVVK